MAGAKSCGKRPFGRSGTTQLAHVGQLAGHRRSRCHRGRDEVGARARTLSAHEIAVAGGGTAFARLQEELDAQIRARMQDTRRILLEHFDEDVHTRLKFDLLGAQQRLDVIGRMFWTLTRTVLADRAQFDDQALSFDLQRSPTPAIQPGLYRLISKERLEQNDSNEGQTDTAPTGEHVYRLGHPLGEHVLAEGKACSTPMATVEFDVTHHPARISVVEQRRGQSGYLVLQHLRIDAYESEDHLLFSAMTDAGSTPTCCRSSARMPDAARRA